MSEISRRETSRVKTELEYETEKKKPRMEQRDVITETWDRTESNMKE